MIQRFLAWWRGAPPAPLPCPGCVALERVIHVKDEMIALLSAELARHEHHVEPIPVPGTPPPRPVEPAGPEPFLARSRRVAPWAQSLAAGGHVDAALQRRHLELTRIPGARTDAQYDEGYPPKPQED